MTFLAHHKDPLMSTPRSRRLATRVAAAAAGVVCFSVASVAHAHIGLPCIVSGPNAGLCVLVDAGTDIPQNWVIPIDTAAEPLKAAPCGLAAGSAYTPSNVITLFRPGQTITVVWHEVVAHSSYFRIAFAPFSPADLTTATGGASLAEPTEVLADGGVVGITPNGGSIGNGGIVLVDYLDPHTGSSVAPPQMWSAQVTLPDTPCNDCTLQVLQVETGNGTQMPEPVTSLVTADSAALYLQCAAITLAADGGVLPGGGDGGSASSTTGADASGAGGSAAASGSSTGMTTGTGATTTGGSSTGGDSGANASNGSSGSGSASKGGCGCRMTSSASAFPAAFVALGTIAAGIRRARSRRRAA